MLWEKSHVLDISFVMVFVERISWGSSNEVSEGMSIGSSLVPFNARKICGVIQYHSERNNNLPIRDETEVLR
jgi:hypothetical protein